MLRHSLLRLGVCVSLMTFFAPHSSANDEIVRPEEIQSLRQVFYDNATYVRLAAEWKAYHEEYPSEFSYSNWMYAARYAQDSNYSKLLAKGLKKYPDNPTLLYLKALERAGAPNNIEGRRLLERAAELDNRFLDPWFVLVTHYMDAGDEGKLDYALRHLLENGAISDVVMDFSYNMLTSLEKGAILITNGDNDTYPGWILTRILKVRPDVAIVNMSLLNSEWYPAYAIRQGLPQFIGPSDLTALRARIMKRLEGSDVWSKPMPAGPFGDSLVALIVASAQRAGRPVYLSCTLSPSEGTVKLREQGRALGLATLVTSSSQAYSDQLRRVYDSWLGEYRVGGLDAWRLHYAPETDAGRWLASNYALVMLEALPAIKVHVPELRLGLFRWYRDHMVDLVNKDVSYRIAQAWGANAADIEEIEYWYKQQGLQ